MAVRLDLSALPGAEADAWEATAAIPPALLRRGGITLAWDLTGPGHDGAGGGTVRLLSIEALEPQEAPAALPLLAEAAVPAEAAAASAAEEEAGAPQPVLTPAFATEARLEAPLAVAPAVQAEPPLVIAVAAPPPVIRWDLSRGFGVPEGPFPEFGLSGPIRWITARSAALVIEASEPRTAPLRLRYRSAIRDQRATVMVNGASAGELAFDGAGRLDEPREAALDLDLRAGPNVVALGFSGAVEEPGSGRELVLLVEEAGLG